MNIVLLFFLLLLFYLLAREIKSTIFVVALWVCFLGIFGNQLVVGVNHGRMPVFLEKISAENHAALARSSRHQEGTIHTKLRVLSDTIFLKKYGNVVSVGDILIFCAIFVPAIFLVRWDVKRNVNFFDKTVPLSYTVGAVALCTIWAIVVFLLHTTSL